MLPNIDVVTIDLLVERPLQGPGALESPVRGASAEAATWAEEMLAT